MFLRLTGLPRVPSISRTLLLCVSRPNLKDLIVDADKSAFDRLYVQRYSVDGPVVLDKINLSIKSGERVGVIGRTGSGKSTLALALLRLIPVEGETRIDGMDTESINLDALRKQITIVRPSSSVFYRERRMID